MSSRKPIFPDWSTFGAQRDAKWLAKQAAARAAARSAVIQQSRGNFLPNRLPVTIPPRMFAPRSGEMKSVDIPTTPVTFNTSTTFWIGLLNGVAPGTARYQRVGNKITPQLVDFQAAILNNGTTNMPLCRIALIWDKQPTGVLPTIDDIYQNVTALGATHISGWPSRNMNTTDRFFTVASQDFHLLPNSASSGGKHSSNCHFIRSLKHLQQQFKGSDSLLPSISTGALYVVAFAHDAVDGQTVTMYYDSRFKYTDL